MKILLNIRWPVGGIRTYLRYVYRQFPLGEFEITLICPPIEEFDVIKEDLGVRLTEVISCPSSSLKFAGQINTLLRSSRFDVIHSHGLSAGLLAAIPARNNRTTHILTLHDVFLPILFKGARGKAKWALINLGLRIPDTIHLLGDGPKKNLEEYFPALTNNQDRIKVIRSGIEVERFSAKRKVIDHGSLRSQIGIPANTKILGFFGRFMSQKGFDILIDAIGLLHRDDNASEIPVIFAWGEGGFIREDRNLIKKRGLSEYFRFLPFVKNISSLLLELDGVVMPSRWEAAPLLPLEVLVSGVPLLASDCIGLKEAISNTPAFHFRPSNSVDLATTIRQWLTDQRKDEFRNFAKEAAERYDVKKTATGLQALYRSILK